MNEGRLCWPAVHVYPADSITLWHCTRCVSRWCTTQQLTSWFQLRLSPKQHPGRFASETPAELKMCRSVLPVAQLGCEQTFNRGCSWWLQFLKPEYFLFSYPNIFSKLGQEASSGLSPEQGSESWRGKKPRKQPLAHSLCSRHLVVEYGCTPEGSGAGKVFPLHSEIFSWEIIGCVGTGGFASFTGFSCCPGNSAAYICCSTHLFASILVFFLLLSIWLLLLKCFAWSGQSIINFLPQFGLPRFFSLKWMHRLVILSVRLTNWFF